MEALFHFNRDFEPEFVNFNTTKIPFDARWVCLNVLDEGLIRTRVLC